MVKIFFILPPLLYSLLGKERKKSEKLSIGHYMVYRERNVDLGVGYLATVLEQNGHDVRILDCDIKGCSAESLRQIIRLENPDVIAINGTTETRFESFAAATISKDIFPDVPVVYGGIHATFTAQDTLGNIPAIDFIIRSEGEISTTEFVSALKNGRGLGSVKGLSFRKDKSIVHNPLAGPIKNLDSIPFPARHLFPLEEYKREFLDNATCNVQSVTPFLKKSDKTIANIVTSRGCPNSCFFCSNTKMWGKFPRFRSAINVVDEICFVMENSGIKDFAFMDDTFTLNRKHVLSIIKEIKSRKINITWRCNARVGTIDHELLSKMHSSGCRYIAFGIESGSEKILRGINKNITVRQVKDFIKILNEHNIFSRAMFMFGLPGETMEDVKKTIDLISYTKSKLPDIWVSFATLIFPGTQLESYAKTNKLLPEGFSWSKPYTQNPKIIGYDTTVPILVQPQMGEKELQGIQNKLFEMGIMSYLT